MDNTKIKDSDRVSVDYEKIIKRAAKCGLSLSQVSRATGRSSGFISAMCSKSSKMLYCDLRQIARALNIHGAAKLIAEDGKNRDIDEDELANVKADMPADERIAIALEEIALLLQKIMEKKDA